MRRHPLTLLFLGLSFLALSVALRRGVGGEAWGDFSAFASALTGVASVLVGFLASAFLAGGRKVVWPLVVHAVVAVTLVATLLAWAVSSRGA